jgi:hypothetical protein
MLFQTLWFLKGKINWKLAVSGVGFSEKTVIAHLTLEGNVRNARKMCQDIRFLDRYTMSAFPGYIPDSSTGVSTCSVH